MEGILRSIQPELTWYVGGLLFLAAALIVGRVVLKKLLPAEDFRPVTNWVRWGAMVVVLIMTLTVGANAFMRTGSNAIPRADITGGSAVFDMQRR